PRLGGVDRFAAGEFLVPGRFLFRGGVGAFGQQCGGHRVGGDDLWLLPGGEDNDVLNRLAEMAGVDDRLSGQDVAGRLVGGWIGVRVGVRRGLRVGHRVRRRARGCGVLPGVRVSTVCLWGGWVWGVLLVAGGRGLLRIRLLGVGSWLWRAGGAGLLVPARVRRLVV